MNVFLTQSWVFLSIQAQDFIEERKARTAAGLTPHS